MVALLLPRWLTTRRQQPSNIWCEYALELHPDNGYLTSSIGLVDAGKSPEGHDMRHRYTPDGDGFPEASVPSQITVCGPTETEASNNVLTRLPARDTISINTSPASGIMKSMIVLSANGFG